MSLDYDLLVDWVPRPDHLDIVLAEIGFFRTTPGTWETATIALGFDVLTESSLVHDTPTGRIHARTQIHFSVSRQVDDFEDQLRALVECVLHLMLRLNVPGIFRQGQIPIFEFVDGELWLNADENFFDSARMSWIPTDSQFRSFKTDLIPE